MTYTGEVTVGGAPDTREAGDLVITKIAVGPMANNAYLLRCALTGEQVLIDAAAEAPRLLELIGDGGLARVITTHRHADHWGALEEVVRATGAETVAGEDDADELPVDVDVRVRTGARVRVGSCELEVIEVVGHTPGSIVLVYDDPDGVTHLFTGDSLFPGGVGRTWSPDDFMRLCGDVESKIFARFDDDTWFYPGHGDDSTLGAERPSLPDWRARGW
ncbi:MBL fold metallo-hydrolase [Aeromicrobium tamlense]|uniref:Glyoxylase-like metal-dependent hydrolase (Beta-lactamase superfamily II) n=1 Tax=Aeromicrobium tamlense TaxID=375541 RepID=A0A8I0FUM8_9ACTN|nr:MULTISPECIES: MBL fold metallo-hydrolase [Aeromicrobium]MBD1270869.1 MBL fold metallo-hydrolase [Aeromicrobium tamlense]NYI38260.1 glyoxylase-like metal-dependent hydrolase (beta-lactamase superfamily II) [Aeromicrobium tamlense]